MRLFHYYLSEVKGIPRTMLTAPRSVEDIDRTVSNLSVEEKAKFMVLVFEDYLSRAHMQVDAEVVREARKKEMEENARKILVQPEPKQEQEKVQEQKTEEPAPEVKPAKRPTKGLVPQYILDDIRAHLLACGEANLRQALAKPEWTRYMVLKVADRMVSEGLLRKEKRGRGPDNTWWFIRVEKQPEPVPENRPKEEVMCVVPTQTQKKPEPEKPHKREISKDNILAHKGCMMALFKLAWDKKRVAEYIGLHDAKDVVMSVLKREIPDLEERYDTGSLCRTLREVMIQCCNSGYENSISPLLMVHKEFGQPDGNMFEARNSSMKAFAKRKGWRC